MKKWEKSPPELEKTFYDVFPDDPRAERRKMFGYPAGFVNGNMFGGLWQTDIVLRLGDADRERISSDYGALPFEPMGRAMKGYVCVPPRIVGHAGQLRDWLQRAFEFVASLPAKEKKAPSAKGTPKRTRTPGRDSKSG
jgi:TfoX/Sxy family transcriptional regulator of competence genes